jgi:hypothetical protein
MNLCMSRRGPALRLALAALIAALNACGGGGGGGGGGGSSAASPTVIDVGNAAAITREVIDVGLGAGAFGAAIGGGGILSADGGSNALVQGMARHRATIQSVQPMVTFGSQTVDCLASGSLTVSGSLASDSTLTPGDRINANFAMCDDADGAVYDGRMRIDVTSFSGDIFSDQFALGAGVLLTDLAITEAGATTVGDGEIHLDLDLTVPLVSDLTVSGGQLQVSSGSESWVLRDFAVTAVEDSTGASLVTHYSGAGSLEGSGFEGAVDFATVNPFIGTGDGFPATGQVLITGAHGATIRATVLDAQNLQLAIDLDGDSAVDDTQQIAWSTVGGLGSEVVLVLPRTP